MVCPLLTQQRHRLCTAAMVFMPVSALSKYSFKPIQSCLLSLGADMRRREFITLLGGAAATWPVAVRAQQVEVVRRIAVLMGAAETASSRGWIAALLHRLDELGWREGRNLVLQVQWWNDQPEQMRVWAAELIARSPDVAVTFTNFALEILKPIAGNVPIVFSGVSDPVGSGFVASLPRPGGNITGFASHEPSMGGKWLGVLKETAPHVN